MNRFISVILSFSFVALFIQCKKDLEEEKRVADDKKIETFLKNYSFVKNNGVYYAAKTPGFGYEIVAGDSVSFWYKGYDLNNKVFDTNILQEAIDANLDTVTRNFDSLVVVAGSGVLVEGLERGLLLCRGGEQSIIAFSSVFGFGSHSFGPISAWSPLVYEIDVIAVSNGKIRAEQTLIQQLLNESEQTLVKHDMGFWYYINSSSAETIYPVSGDTIYGWFCAKTPQGIIADEVAYQNEELVIGSDELKTGLSTAFTLLTPGDSATLIVPSPIAYGVEGGINVEPYTPIIYDIRLDSIK